MVTQRYYCLFNNQDHYDFVAETTLVVERLSVKVSDSANLAHPRINRAFEQS